jgi:DNA-binding SARP family transcriptional activator
VPLRVTLAGRVGVEVDGDVLPLTGLGRVGRLALAYLVCERHRPVSRDELADTLWAEDLPRSWEQMLRGLTSKLRGTLGEAGLDPAQALVTAFGAYQLRLPDDAVVDIEEATADRDAALVALVEENAGRSLELATAAVAVAGRQFVPGAVGIWIERRQAELRELHLSALEVASRAATALGRLADAVAAAEEAIAQEPFRESAYVALIGAHAAGGNRAEALRAYERCRRVLAEELGVNPSSPTEAAYLAVLQDDLAPTDRQAAALPLPAALGPDAGASLWGREAELDRLAQAFKRIETDGRQVVVLGGEAGIGKTALVAAAARQAHADGARVLYGRCDEDLELPYQPFAEALSHFVSHAEARELAAHVDAHGGDLARLAPELIRRLPDVTVRELTDPEADRYRLFDTVASMLADAAERAPGVLILDDLHWATSGTLQLLRHVLRSTAAASLLVLGTYRHTEVSDGLADTLADLRREAHGVDRLQLEGLDTHDVAAFMESIPGLARDDDPLTVAEAVRVHTGGNPFFVGELLRHLAETGATYRRQRPWSYYADGDDVGVPQGVQEVVARRLRRLSEMANRAIVWASVIGAEFDLGLLERVGDAGDPFDRWRKQFAATSWSRSARATTASAMPSSATRCTPR